MTWQKIKCFFGFHDWEYKIDTFGVDKNGVFLERRCQFCPKKQVRIK